MASGQVSAVVRQIERLFTAGSVTGMSEGQLLERFVARRDEAAFAALVARYGPMVLGVCRQMLHDPNDVDDAFQATFLVLVRKAGTLRNRDLLGNWLYGVAYKVAHRARTVKARRHATETPCVEELAMGPDQAAHQPQPWIHEEVQRLPEKYRTPVVLCYLQGLTHEEAAERLRWPLGTVKGRLARARDMLRSRLTRRGMAFSSGILFLELARDARATVPNSLFESTIRAATTAATGRAATGLISAQAVVLSEGVLRTMLIAQLKTVAVSILVAGLVTTSAGVFAYQGARPDQKSAIAKPSSAPPVGTNAGPTAKVVTEEPVEAKKAQAIPGATEPATQAAAGPEDRERSLAQRVFDNTFRLYTGGEMNDVERLNMWSLRILEAESRSEPSRRAATQAHLKRMESLFQASRKRFEADQATQTQVGEAEFYVVDAAKRLASVDAAKAGQAAPTTATNALPGLGGGGGGGAIRRGRATPGGAAGPLPDAEAKKLDEQETRVEIARVSAQLAANDDSPKNKAILTKLDEPISMSFANETPLEDVLKYIKSATTKSDKDLGIPIYVDPAGLEEAGVTMTSAVCLDLEGVPLKTTLRLALKQIKLAFCVKEGVLMISSVDGIRNELAECEDGGQ